LWNTDFTLNVRRLVIASLNDLADVEDLILKLYSRKPLPNSSLSGTFSSLNDLRSWVKRSPSTRTFSRLIELNESREEFTAVEFYLFLAKYFICLNQECSRAFFAEILDFGSLVRSF
jgi:hypothetical protein